MDSLFSQPTESAARPAKNAGLQVEGESAEAVVQSLRVGLLGLAAALLFLSICFSLFVHKQNNTLIAQIDTQTRLLRQGEPIFESNKQRIDLLVMDLRGFAQAHADLVPILVKYNYMKAQQQPAFAPSFPAPIPRPSGK